MADDQKITPKLSKRFSDLFGVDEHTPEFTIENDAHAAVYLEESRKLNLNKLLHLAPYSEVLLLLGGQGVGCTTLLKAFVQRAATTWRISFVSASALMDGATFLRRIGNGFELDLDDTASVDDLLWEIARYLQALGRSGRRAIIIVDDAHLLTDEVILLAEKILRDERTDDCVSLVLSMRQDQSDKLDRFAVLKERLAYTIRLEPLSRKEVDGYLRQRLSAMAVQPERLLNSETVESIHRNSGGLPERVNALAHELLAGQKRPVTHGGGRKWSVLALSAVALVGVAVLLYQDEINRMFEAPTQPSLSEAARDNAAEMPPGAIGDQDNGASDVITGEAVAALEDETDSPLGLPVSEEIAVGQEAGQTPAVAQTELGTVTEPQLSAPESIEPGAMGIPAKERAEATPAQLEPSAPARSPQMAWLLAQPEDHYTLQLMALGDRGDVIRFIEKHGIAAESATFPVTRRGKVLTVLVYGSYPSRAAAGKAAAGLPRAWGVGQPWIRQFAGVRQDLAEK